MAKVSSVQKNNRRKALAQKHAPRRARLKAVIMDRNASPEERMSAQMKINVMPRNGALIRVRNRCEISGRSRGVYRKFKMSRIALRELGALGMLPGVVKSSW